MPATYSAKSIFLEVEFFGDDRDEILLQCQAVTVERGAILVRGAETHHLNAILWIPDALYFQAYNHHRFPVGRPIVLDRDVA
ncbi:hypothetical protein [Cupriavidus gilardii]|uniref:hypothetical protein n=1 Tax=Cupriavidus gilardii TaxID=82541 RepID=UPI00157446EA|nr:hypothetical protein [Cupriavidus gilardii]NSX03497.1 hypothetical protein [Cupriavidus gilardii]